MLKSLKYTTLMLFLLGGIGAALAHGGASGIVKKRMDAMGMIGKATKAIGQTLRGQADYDAKAIRASSQVIANHAGEALTVLFPEGSLKKPTEATKAIWEDWDRFAKLAARLEKRALALAALAENGADKADVEGAFGQVAGTCKACHEDFRQKKQ